MIREAIQIYSQAANMYPPKGYKSLKIAAELAQKFSLNEEAAELWFESIYYSHNVAIIFSIVFVSVILDFYQESKAERAAEALKEKVTTTATVLRDGVKQEVKLSEIVPGDIIYLSAGDIVPADSRVITAKDLFLNQSALTGESFPVEKHLCQ